MAGQLKRDRYFFAASLRRNLLLESRSVLNPGFRIRIKSTTLLYSNNCLQLNILQRSLEYITPHSISFCVKKALFLLVSLEENILFGGVGKITGRRFANPGGFDPIQHPTIKKSR